MSKNKKIFIVTIFILLLVGCAPARDSDFDSSVSTISSDSVANIGVTYLEDYEVICFTARLYSDSISIDCIPTNQLSAVVTMGLK